jgi:site-specific recombinase XerD
MLAQIEQFISWMRIRSLQARTWQAYKCDLQLFGKLMAEGRLEEIRPRDLDESVRDQIQRGYKPSTVNRRLAAIVSLYRFLIVKDKTIIRPVLTKRL